jgi:hypothetical protein
VSIMILGVFVLVSQTPAALIHQWKLDDTLTWTTIWTGAQDSVGGNPAGDLTGYTATDPVNTNVTNQSGTHGFPDKAYNFIERS